MTLDEYIKGSVGFLILVALLVIVGLFGYLYYPENRPESLTPGSPPLPTSTPPTTTPETSPIAP